MKLCIDLSFVYFFQSAEDFRRPPDDFLPTTDHHLESGNSSLCVSDHPLGAAAAVPGPQVPANADINSLHDQFQPVIHHQYNGDAASYNGLDFQHLEVSSR